MEKQSGESEPPLPSQPILLTGAIKRKLETYQPDVPTGKEEPVAHQRFNGKISRKDRELLRTLAKEWAETAALPIQEDRWREWRRHNDLEPGRPMIHCVVNDAWREFWKLEIEEPQLRGIEWLLRNNPYASRLPSDFPLKPSFPVGYVYKNADFGMAAPIHNVQEGGAYSWDPLLRNPADLRNLVPGVEVDIEASEYNRDMHADIFGDILEIDYGGRYSPSLDNLAINLRGMNQLMLDMYDEGEFVHELMSFLRDQVVDCCHRMEQNGELTISTTDHFWNCSTLADGYDGHHVRLTNLSADQNGQGFTGISPDMFEEFVFPYQQAILEMFGASRYGCCEPLHHWLDIILRIKNLRRVNLTPWSDMDICADKLRNHGGVIVTHKVHPNMVGLDRFDPESIEKELRRVVRTCEGLRVELWLADQGTVNHQPDRLRQWCEIARKVAEDEG